MEISFIFVLFFIYFIRAHCRGLFHVQPFFHLPDRSSQLRLKGPALMKKSPVPAGKGFNPGPKKITLCRGLAQGSCTFAPETKAKVL